MSAPPTRVVAIIGTKGPFPRLVDALADWARRHPGSSVWVQHGEGGLPAPLEGVALVARADLLARVDAADVVVCHAGSGTVRDALTRGHVPVVVPRRAHHGEHVNDHQVELVEALGDRIVRLDDVAALDAALIRAAARRGEPDAAAGAGALLEALRSDLDDATPPRRAGTVWTALRIATWWLPAHRHGWRLKP